MTAQFGIDARIEVLLHANVDKISSTKSTLQTNQCIDESRREGGIVFEPRGQLKSSSGART